MKHAILFDFDGTVANTVSALREGINLTMDDLGYPRHTDEDILQYVNHGARELVRLALPPEKQTDESVINKAFALYDRHYLTVCYHTENTYPGVDTLIERLHNEGCRIGILSNKQAPILERLTAAVLKKGSYDGVQGVEAGKPTKPDRFMTENLAAKLGVNPSDCVVVGDSDVDILTAKNGGAKHIAVTWGFRDEAFLRAAGATCFAHTPDELYRLIKIIFQ